LIQLIDDGFELKLAAPFARTDGMQFLSLKNKGALSPSAGRSPSILTSLELLHRTSSCGDSIDGHDQMISDESPINRTRK
jgi:hypothetical protein